MMTTTYYERLELKRLPMLGLRYAGYENIPPCSGAVNNAPLTIVCADCGVRAEYSPWSKRGSFRAFVVCPECGRALEF